MNVDVKIIQALTRQLNDLVAACTDTEGKPKAPDRKSLMTARACLPKGYSMTLIKDKLVK